MGSINFVRRMATDAGLPRLTTQLDLKDLASKAAFYCICLAVGAASGAANAWFSSVQI
jgi:hypothetical protein